MGVSTQGIPLANASDGLGHRSQRFAVVGVGASAGGIKATAQLLEHLGSAPNLALLVVHHLERQRESRLAEVLSAATALPVVTAVDGAAFEPNHVYVAPSTHGLVINEGRLRLIERLADGGFQHPIDRLFDSLATECGSLAVGVLLSGTGTDGSIGAKAIKAAGGITFAQDGSAEFPEMPNAAAGAGGVDIQLSPEAISNELKRVAASTSRTLVEQASDEEEFKSILAVLGRVSGLDFSGYKESTLRRRIQRRVFLRKMSGLRDYLGLLERDTEEARALSEEALIHVTSFFRDPSVFEVLKTRVLPKLLKDQQVSPIRIWVPACSTGEEVYSLAICVFEFLSEVGAQNVRLKLFGTDVSVAAVDAARAARYSESIEQDVSRSRLEAFFTHAGGGYQLKKQVRDACVFAKHDATRDPPFSCMDLISCRNLMIYLTPALQERLLPTFHYALNSPGFLVLGSSESVRSFPGFSTLDAECKIFSRGPLAARPSFNFSYPNLPDPIARALQKPASASDVLRAADRVVLAHLEPAAVVVTDELLIVEFRGKTGRYLAPAPGEARLDLMRMAREELRIPLRQVIDQAREKRALARLPGVRVSDTPGARIDLEAIPFGGGTAVGQGYFVVLFREPEPAPQAVFNASIPSQEAPADALQQELISTREYLQSVIEKLELTNDELRAANEEITSSNEELRSTNDELEVAKEELQATNQELLSVNEEMRERNELANRLNDDLTNVFGSVGVPVVLLDRESRIRRFTPAAERLFRLSPADVGEPLNTRRSTFAAECARMSAQALAKVEPVERAVQDESGHWYLFVTRPYLTLDRRVDGTILTIFDVDAVTGTSVRDILTGATEAILMIAQNGRIAFANNAAAELFGYDTDDLASRHIDDLVPEPLQASHAQDREHYFLAPVARDLGRGRAVLGRRKDGSSFPIEVALNPTRRAEGVLVVAFVTDISARQSAELEIQWYQERLKQMAFDAAVAEERERRRIAVNLHDQIGQALALANIKLASARESVSGEARESIDGAADLLAQSLAVARTLIFDLSPPILYDLGLKEALSWLAEDVQRRYGIPITVRVDAEPTPLDDASAALVFRAVRELLINVFRHSQSTTATLTVKRLREMVSIEVADQGVGFDPAASRDSGRGFGLFSVYEQITRLGGSLDVTSQPQQGTRVTLRVPLNRAPSVPPRERQPAGSEHEDPARR